MSTQISQSSGFFSEIKKQAKAIQSQISLLDKRKQARLKVFNACMNQYQRYVKKENEILDKNLKHCEPRNMWFREEVNKSWKIAIADRNFVLRSVARTNVLKKDLDQWLQRINQSALEEQQRQSFVSNRQELQDSKLMDKYNEILREYGHRM